MVDGFIIEPAVAVSQSFVMVCDRPNIGLTSIEREREWGLDLTVTFQSQAQDEKLHPQHILNQYARMPSMDNGDRVLPCGH